MWLSVFLYTYTWFRSLSHVHIVRVTIDWPALSYQAQCYLEYLVMPYIPVYVCSIASTHLTESYSPVRQTAIAPSLRSTQVITKAGLPHTLECPAERLHRAHPGQYNTSSLEHKCTNYSKPLLGACGWTNERYSLYKYSFDPVPSR